MTVVGGYRKYEEISFLRGVAITTVILMHLIQVFVAEGNIPGTNRSGVIERSIDNHIRAYIRIPDGFIY